MRALCKTCNRIFEAKPFLIMRGRKYCSHYCYWQSLRKSLKGKNNPHYKGKVNKKCLSCGKIFTVYPNLLDRKQTFCTYDCYIKAVKLPNKICSVCGKSFHTRKHDGKFCSQKCQWLYRLEYPIRYWLGKKRENLSGEKNPAWKGGVTKLNKILRSATQFKEWRKKVFERDNFICQICFQRGGFLEPHHIKSVAAHPELVFEVNNGITLCINCHKKTDKWRR